MFTKVDIKPNTTEGGEFYTQNQILKKQFKARARGLPFGTVTIHIHVMSVIYFDQPTHYNTNNHFVHPWFKTPDKGKEWNYNKGL